MPRAQAVHVSFSLMMLKKILAGVRAPCGLLYSGQTLLWSIPQLKELSRGDRGVC